MRSIVSNEDRCFVCGTVFNLETHHIFYGVGRRKLCDKDHIVVKLCREHHTGINGVHNNIDLDNKLKQIGQKAYEENHSRQEFMDRYGRNYL